MKRVGRVVKGVLEKEVLQERSRALVHWAVSEASLGGGIDPWVLRCWIAAWSSVWRCAS